MSSSPVDCCGIRHGVPLNPIVRPDSRRVLPVLIAELGAAVWLRSPNDCHDGLLEVIKAVIVFHVINPLILFIDMKNRPGNPRRYQIRPMILAYTKPTKQIAPKIVQKASMNLMM